MSRKKNVTIWAPRKARAPNTNTRQAFENATQIRRELNSQKVFCSRPRHCTKLCPIPRIHLENQSLRTAICPNTYTFQEAAI